MTKRILALLLVTLATLTLSLNANARKFGGGHSWGHSYHTSRSYHPSYAHNNGSVSGYSRPRFSHGLLGGLVVGGILGSMFGHHGYGYGGGYGGFGFGHLLIWLLIGWVVWRLIRGHRGNLGQSGPSLFNQGGGSAKEFDLPPGFDVNGFLEGAKNHYHILQTAWNHNDFSTIGPYLAPELYQQMMAERAKFGSQPLNNQILYVDASLVRSQQYSGQQQVSVHFNGQYKTTDGRQVRIDEIWHLRRDSHRVSSSWLIEGIEERSEQ
ncbi:Tim44 domain-containing protein [Celerinatantimonas yamalensis]|uniref:Tim44-like domain-containing protein n=1 Tax=Celerinatantimonas yamalensis TaxID=559956 RepID=A0ABW9GAT3_9GAMM